MDEGYIKFTYEWVETGPIGNFDFSKLNYWRNKLWKLNLIGVYDNGIRFGNISQRAKKNFIITGTQTSHLETIDSLYYTQVTDYDILNNFVRCEGPIKASSETLTHAIIYDLDHEINGVIHVHHDATWKRLKNVIPTTSEHISYGTPAMAKEVRRLYQETNLRESKIVAMAGHEGGIITFGSSLDEAGQILLYHFSSKSV